MSECALAPDRSDPSHDSTSYRAAGVLGALDSEASAQKKPKLAPAFFLPQKKNRRKKLKLPLLTMPRCNSITVDVCTTSCGASVGPPQKPWLVRRNSLRFEWTIPISSLNKATSSITQKTSGPTDKDRIPGANGKVACYYHLHGGCQTPWCSFWHAPTDIIRPTTPGVYKVFAQNMPGDIDVYELQKLAEAIGELTTSKVKDLRTGKVFVRPKIKKFHSTMQDGRYAFATHFKYAKAAEAFVDKLNKTPFGNNKINAELQEEHALEILDPVPIREVVCQPVRLPEEDIEVPMSPMSTPTSVIPDLKVDEDGFTPIRRRRKKKAETSPAVTVSFEDEDEDKDKEKDDNYATVPQAHKGVSWADVVRSGATLYDEISVDTTPHTVVNDDTTTNATLNESATYAYMNECIVEHKGDDCAYIYLPSTMNDDDDYEVEEVFARHYLNARGLARL